MGLAAAHGLAWSKKSAVAGYDSAWKLADYCIAHRAVWLASPAICAQ